MIVTFSQLGRIGRLCNQAYQIASTIGIARRNGFDFAFPEWINHDHRDRFGSSEDVEIYKHFVTAYFAGVHIQFMPLAKQVTGVIINNFFGTGNTIINKMTNHYRVTTVEKIAVAYAYF